MGVETKTFNGWPLGSNLAVNPDEIEEGYARYIQDALLDQPGIARTRGPVQSIFNGTTGRRPVGITGTHDASGNYRICLIESDGTSIFINLMNSPYTAVTTSITTVPTGVTIPATGTAWLFDSKPALGGGVVIGMAASDGPRVENTPSDILWLWKGSTKAAYTTGSFSCTFGSATITGSGTTWTSNVEPGMFVIGKDTGTQADGLGRLIGVVKSVDSNTQITLERVSPNTLAGSGYAIVPIRRLASVHNVKRGRGLITCSTAGATVTGVDTSFVDDSLGTSYALYRASDGAYVGTVLSVQGQRNLTLSTSAVTAMDNEEFYAMNITAGSAQYYLPTGNLAYEPPMVGFLNATWQRQQWYANRPGVSSKGSPLQSRDWVAVNAGGILDSISFSETDGSFFDIESATGPAPIKAIAPTESMQLVMKEDETYGISGTDIDSYQADRILSDGALSAMCVVPYQNGCVWAGKRGIYLFDGRQVENIVEGSLDQFYTTIAQSMDLSTKRAWAFIDRDHYFVHLEQVTVPTGYGVVKGAAGETQVGSIPITICINLKTKAATFMTNLYIRGAHRLPASAGGYSLYLVHRYNAGNLQTSICKSSDLFLDTTTQDQITCNNAGAAATAGPDYYIESSLNDAGDEELRKLWKMLMVWHWNEGGTLTVDVVKGLGNDYTTSGTTLTATTVVNGTGFINQRIKFLKRNQYLGFRIYKTPAAGTTRVKIGAWALGYKRQRPGRV